MSLYNQNTIQLTNYAPAILYITLSKVPAIWSAAEDVIIFWQGKASSSFLM